MGSTGSGNFSDYPGNGNAVKGVTGGESGVNACERAFKTRLEDVATSDSGYEIQSQFDKIVTLIEKKYGKSKKIDYVDYDYEFTDDEHWLQSILDDARTYKARWNCPADDMYAYDGISSISLGVGGYKEKSAYLWLEYCFLNYNDAESYNNDVF